MCLCDTIMNLCHVWHVNDVCRRRLRGVTANGLIKNSNLPFTMSLSLHCCGARDNETGRQRESERKTERWMERAYDMQLNRDNSRENKGQGEIFFLFSLFQQFYIDSFCYPPITHSSNIHILSWCDSCHRQNLIWRKCEINSNVAPTFQWNTLNISLMNWFMTFETNFQNFLLFVKTKSLNWITNKFFVPIKTKMNLAINSRKRDWTKRKKNQYWRRFSSRHTGCMNIPRISVCKFNLSLKFDLCSFFHYFKPISGNVTMN